MPYLGDYLGQLLSEISMARMQADLETVRLAELYAMHPLLRTLPVPHVRLPEVDLDIPMLIKASDEPRAGESARGGATVTDMSRKFDEALTQYVSSAGVKLSKAESAQLRAVLDERLTSTGKPTEISIDVRRIADDLSSTALRFIGELRPRPDVVDPAISLPMAAEFRDIVRLEFLKLRSPPPRLTVLVTSAEIREAGTTENTMRLRLKVSEQGLEWTSIESEAGSHDRLVPE